MEHRSYWLELCAPGDFDHPHALPNYRARGYREPAPPE